MKALSRTITVFVTVYLLTAGFALAQPAPEPTPPEPVHVEAVQTAEKEIQLKVARDQLETSRAQLEAAKALSKVNKDFSKLHLNLGMTLPHSGTDTVLVIPTSEMNAEELVTIVEDMTVMSRIIDNQLGSRESRRFMFSGDFLWQSSRMAETMYLQGYGALFLKKVDFPLSPGPTVQEEEKETTKEAVDPVWNQMKQEIYEPQEERRRRMEREEEKYDAEKVENLKTNIIKALKHATNIRSLKTDESVVITVTGSGDSPAITNIAIAGTTGDIVVKNKTTRVITPTPRPGGWESSSSTVLIIRAKKSDIDAFTKGDLDFEKFRERVQIFTYPYLGEPHQL
jgi:hypothetical protein